MKQTIWIFSGIAGALLILLNIRKLSVYHSDGNTEIWTVAFAIMFVIAGVVLGRVMMVRNSATDTNQKEDPDETLTRLGITSREYEVLKLVAAGHSNLEISKTLFISESTVKTHVSSILSKLNARRRTQAVQRAIELNLV